MAFDPDKYIASKSQGSSFDPDAYLATKQSPQEKAWYDVPGKIGNTWQGVNSAIQQEAQITASGKQNPIVGGAMSMAEMAGGVGNTIGNIVEPIFNNPATRNLSNMVAGGIRSKPSNRQSIPWSGNIVNTQNENNLDILKKQFADNPEYMNRLNAAGGLANLVGLKMGVGDINKPVLSFAESLKEGGRKGIKETFKIKDVTAKQAGTTSYKGVENIVDWMNNFKLEGRPKAVLEKTQKMIDGNEELADNAMANYIKSNPTDKIKTNTVFGNMWDDLNKGKIEGTAIASEEQQDAAMKQITDMLAKKELVGNLTPDKIPELKKVLKTEIGLFAKGSVTPESNLLKKLGDEYYRRIKVSLEDKIPEIADPNNNIHKLIIIKNAAEDAEKRIGNKYDFGLIQQLQMFGAPVAAGVATGGDVGMMGAGLAAGTALAGHKLLGGGRIAAGQMKLSRALEAATKPMQKSRLGMLGNERGSIGTNPQVKTDNFKQWFGDWENAPDKASKVVDAEGKPLVVYHGTKNEFSEFSSEKAGSSGLARTGKDKVLFFTDTPQNAEFYANSPWDRGRVSAEIGADDNYREAIKLYKEKFPYEKIANMQDLDLKHKIIAERDKYFNDIVKPIEKIKSDYNYGKIPRNSSVGGQNIKPVFLDFKNPVVYDVNGRVTTNRETVKKLIKEAKQKGNDGIILKNVRDFSPDSPTYTHYVAFSPNQIKSATGNSGAFSKATNDIRGNTGLKMLAGTAAGGIGAGTIAGMVNRKKGK